MFWTKINHAASVTALIGMLVLGTGVSLLEAAEKEPKKVEPSAKWSGSQGQGNNKSGLSTVTDKDEWAKVWKLYQGDAKLPEVDFSKSFVVVALHSDGNRVSLDMSLTEKGDLKILALATQIGFPPGTPGTFLLAQVPREGVKTVNGKEIGKAKE